MGQSRRELLQRSLRLQFLLDLTALKSLCCAESLDRLGIIRGYVASHFVAFLAYISILTSPLAGSIVLQRRLRGGQG